VDALQHGSKLISRGWRCDFDKQGVGTVARIRKAAPRPRPKRVSVRRLGQPGGVRTRLPLLRVRGGALVTEQLRANRLERCSAEQIWQSCRVSGGEPWLRKRVNSKKHRRLAAAAAALGGP